MARLVHVLVALLALTTCTVRADEEEDAAIAEELAFGAEGEQTSGWPSNFFFLPFSRSHGAHAITSK